MTSDAQQKVAVIDDDPAQAGVIEELVIDAGLKPLIVPKKFGKSLGALVGEVKNSAEAAICDHRLSPRGYATFAGAEAVARLYEEGIPALLLTQFEVDSDTELRLWRAHVPVLLTREEVSAQSISVSLEYARGELAGTVATERIAQRCIVRIVDVEPDDDAFDVVVTGWRPHTAVRLPMKLLPKALRREAKIDACFVAAVNIDADRPADLYFKDFELAPEPLDTSDTQQQEAGRGRVSRIVRSIRHK